MSAPARSEPLRLFIAIAVPEDVMKQLERTQAQLDQGLESATIRWVPRYQLHLTLRFLGNTDPAHVPSLNHALNTVCARFGPIDLRAQALGVFPNLRNPRVLWAGVLDSTGQLEPFQRSIQERVKAVSSQDEEERFHAHITLARVKTISPRDLRLLRQAVESHSQAVFGAWTSREVHLVQSELSSTGSQYTVLTKSPLSCRP